MGFSCTIKAGKKDLTTYEKGPINCQLLNLGPNSSGSTDAPYRVSDFRSVVLDAKYADKYPEIAQDAFRQLQAMAAANLDSLKQDKHCETCSCDLPDRVPSGWSIEACKELLDIDAKTVTYIDGGQ